MEIYHVNLVNFKTSGKRGEAYETAAATKYIKEQEAKGIQEIAKADADRTRELAKAERENEIVIAEGEAKRIKQSPRR